ncbi:MAG: Zn-ribbon domain-containing OB-fold protein [Burkholderiales bacterium]|nr:Zn-ribbon domain-containing OB-fold protein [Burkholderiales bacterium]
MARRVPRPMVQAETAAYWQAADEGRLLVKRCSACGEFHHYPRDLCPFCLSDATEWVEAAGTGTVYSFSTMGQGEAAYTLAYVTLDEGPTMLTNLVGADPSAFAIGQPVRVVFTPSEGGPAVPMFTPA